MLKDFLTAQFLFGINRIQLESIDKFFLFIGLVSVVIAGILKLAEHYALNPIDAKHRGKLFSPFLFLGLGEIIWYFARVQLIRFFGSHFLALLIIVTFIIWLGILLIKTFKTYKQEKTVWEKEQVKEKYLLKK